MTRLIKMALVVACCVSLNKVSASDQKYCENMGKPAMQATSASPEEQVAIKGSADASQAVFTRSLMPTRCSGCFDNKETKRSKQRKNRARIVEQESHTVELIKNIGQGLYVIRQPSPTPREE